MKDFLIETADFNFNKDAAQIGTQGPDIFFFHRILPIAMPGFSMCKIGSALHRTKPAEIFEAFAEYCRISPSPNIAKSYIYGFIIHYALDRNCHPFVYCLQNKILENNKHIHKSSAHNRIEMAMDTYLLNKRMNISDTRSFDTAKTLDAPLEVIDEISHLLAFTIARVTTYSPKEKDIATAIADTKTMQKILRNKNGIIGGICRGFETIIGPVCGYYKFSAMIRPRDLEKAKKYGNINNMTWISPFTGEKSNLSFEDLFLIAKKDAQNLIQGFNRLCKGYSNGYEITNNISFLTGTEVK